MRRSFRALRAGRERVGNVPHEQEKGGVRKIFVAFQEKEKVVE